MAAHTTGAVWKEATRPMASTSFGLATGSAGNSSAVYAIMCISPSAVVASNRP